MIGISKIREDYRGKYYVAKLNRNNKSYSKMFTLNKYGNKAFEEACKWRIAKEIEIKKISTNEYIIEKNITYLLIPDCITEKIIKYKFNTIHIKEVKKIYLL